MENKTQNLEGLSNKFYEPHTAWPILMQNFLKLPEKYNFDLEKMRLIFKDVINGSMLKPLVTSKDGTKVLRSYRGFGLTARQNCVNPLYDAFSMYDENGYFNSSSQYQFEDDDVQQRSAELDLKERNFNVKNQFFTEDLAAILNKFSSPYNKVRLLELRPGGRIAPHIDFPYYDQIRVHAALYTNEDAWWEVAGQKIQIPADGSFYWFDAGKAHSVWNNGSTTRIILSVHLSIFFDLEHKPRPIPTKNLISLIQQGLI